MVLALPSVTRNKNLYYTEADDIKELPAERVLELYKRIKPIVKDEGKLYYLTDTDPVATSYMWEGKTTVEATGIEPFAEVRTLHKRYMMDDGPFKVYRYVFRPTVSEVLSQIPEELLERTVAFQVKTDSEGMTEKYRRTITILYEKKQ